MGRASCPHINSNGYITVITVIMLLGVSWYATRRDTWSCFYGSQVLSHIYMSM
jgi:hypothetical protein